jgi:hypothetical protein
MEANQEDKDEFEDPQEDDNQGEEDQDAAVEQGDADEEEDEQEEEIEEDAMDILQYMRDTLHLSNLVATALGDGGLDNFEDLIDTTDDDIIAVVKNTRRLGGYIPAAAAGAAPVVNRGINVTEKDCLRVCQLGHYCYHMDHIQQTICGRRRYSTCTEGIVDYAHNRIGSQGN